MRKKIDREVISKIAEISVKVENEDLQDELLSTIEFFLANAVVRSTKDSLVGFTHDRSDIFRIKISPDSIEYDRVLAKLGEENKTIIAFKDEDQILVEEIKSYSSEKDNQIERLHKSKKTRLYLENKLIYQETIDNDYSTALKDYSKNITEQEIIHADGKGAIKVCHKIYQGYPESSYTHYFDTTSWQAPDYNAPSLKNNDYLIIESMSSISREEYFERLKQIESNINSNKKQKRLDK